MSRIYSSEHEERLRLWRDVVVAVLNGGSISSAGSFSTHINPVATADWICEEYDKRAKRDEYMGPPA